MLKYRNLSTGTLLCLVLTMFAGCSNVGGANSDDAVVAATGAPSTVTVHKSPNDEREYRYLVLANGLRVLLVQDPKTDKAAAALAVLRGSFHEPKQYPGLAHFLEHMLFIGTEKFPEVDAYQTFINAHGGSSNAYTSLDHTNYFFDIQPEYFPEAMDRFAQFFIAPLLDPTYVDREKNAVHSEYQLQYKNDGWRAYLTQKLALNPEHPGSRFTIGSLETLGDGVHPALQTFFKENYSADQMILVALSNEELDDIEAWVTPLVTQIPNRNIGPAATLPAAFSKGSLPATLRLNALADKDRLSLTFPVPSTDDYLREKPALFITNLLGHEGAGSLHAQLTQLGWIETLGAGSERFDDATTLVNIDMGLTAQGLKQVPQITDLVFDYIALMQNEAPAERIFAEQSKVLDLAFRFQEAGSATGFVYRTAPELAQVAPEDVLRAPYRMDRFDPKLISRYLTYLTPDNLLLQISGPNIKGDLTEPWFDVSYSLEVGPVARGDVSAKDMALPAANPFLPDSVTLLSDNTAGPALVIDQPGVEIWHDRDTGFGSPRANLFLNIGVKGGITTAQTVAKAYLYEALVSDSLNEYVYPAKLAGLAPYLVVSSAGIEVRLQGYEDKQPLLLQKVLHTLRNLEIDPERFALRQAELANNWRSSRTDHPFRQTSAAINHLLVSSSWSPELLADTIETLTPKDLESWSSVLDKVSIQGLLHGNADASRVKEIQSIIDQELTIEAFPLRRPQIADPGSAKRLPLAIDHQDATMILYLQDPDSSLKQRALSTLAVHLMRQPFFTELRTQKQLGYVVGVSNKQLFDRSGVAFVVQSPVANVEQLQQETYGFVARYLATIANMPLDEFQEYREGLIVDLTEQDKNLAQRSARLWSNLKLGDTEFNRREKLAAAINNVSKEDALTYLQQLQVRLPKERLIVYSPGKFDVAPTGGQKIDAPIELKQRLFSSAD